MQISSGDQQCRYLPTVGTQTASFSPFGDVLKRFGITLSQDCSLEDMVSAGWVRPSLREVLPRAAFDAWRDYPSLSMNGWDDCHEGDRWALSLYSDALAGPTPRRSGDWWTHFLDDPADPLAQAARGNSIDSAAPDALPAAFLHAHSGREIRPWLDYFAYWQVFPIAEILDALTCTVRLSERAVAAARDNLPVAQRFARARVHSIVRKWEGRRATFEWLSRVRTVLGATVAADRSWNDVDAALRSVVDSLGLTVERMLQDLRDTLLVMWREGQHRSVPTDRGREWLRGLLRQEIQYVVTVIERLTGEAVDFLDTRWYDARQAHEWTCLVEALPLEEELARRDFPHGATMYLRKYAGSMPNAAVPDEDGLRGMLTRHWLKNRPLRRFVLAFDRLHRELAGEQLMHSEGLVHAAERIEQFLLTVLHAERFLSLIYRERKQVTEYPEVRKLANDALNHVLNHFGVNKHGVGQAALARTQELMAERAMLHDLGQAAGLRLVVPTEVKSGSDAADHLVASFVNLVIARNYAAHHDALDTDLIYPDEGEPDQHPGHRDVRLIRRRPPWRVAHGLPTRGRAAHPSAGHTNSSGHAKAARGQWCPAGIACAPCSPATAPWPASTSG